MAFKILQELLLLPWLHFRHFTLTLYSSKIANAFVIQSLYTCSSHYLKYFLHLCTNNIPISVSVSSVTQLFSTLCNPRDCSTPSFPVHHQLPGLTETHVHWVSDAIQPSHPLPPPSPPTFNLSQYQGLLHWASSSHQVAKVSEFRLQHQSFQQIFRTDFL